jgi:DNA-binding transcriptional regulator LsrR (DeoR family)
VTSYANNVDVCIAVARLFYESQLSQTEIAEQLRLSRPTVAAVLRRARELGVVQITVRDPRTSAADLEQALAAAYPGTQILVAPGRFISEEIARQMSASRAAAFLRSILLDGMTVGLGWGTAIRQLVATLDHQKDVRIQVLPMLGGSGQIAPHYQVNELVRRFADAFRGQSVFLHVPVLVDSAQLREDLISESSIRAVWERFASLDVAITGVGTILTSAIDVLGVDQAWAELFPELMRSQIAGQMCLRCFDVEGRDAEHSLDCTLMAITLPEFRKARYRVGLAVGRAKVRALRAALSGQILNVLITDEDTALQILERDTRTPEGATVG